MTKNTAAIDTDAIRTRMGQGLWGTTITSLCDEVDRLKGLLDEAAAERDELAVSLYEMRAAEADAILADPDTTDATAEPAKGDE